MSRATGIRIEIVADALPDELPEEHKICVFRIVQVALNNVCRHARASSVQIALVAVGSKLSVAIRDDGKGFSPSRKTGLGLIGMQERVERLGGRLDHKPRARQGTQLDFSLPLPQRAIAGRPAIATLA